MTALACFRRTRPELEGTPGIAERIMDLQRRAQAAPLEGLPAIADEVTSLLSAAPALSKVQRTSLHLEQSRRTPEHKPGILSRKTTKT
jgi:hypothetical protein